MGFRVQTVQETMTQVVSGCHSFSPGCYTIHTDDHTDESARTASKPNRKWPVGTSCSHRSLTDGAAEFWISHCRRSYTSAYHMRNRGMEHTSIEGLHESQQSRSPNCILIAIENYACALSQLNDPGDLGHLFADSLRLGNVLEPRTNPRDANVDQYMLSLRTYISESLLYARLRSEGL